PIASRSRDKPAACDMDANALLTRVAGSVTRRMFALMRLNGAVNLSMAPMRMSSLNCFSLDMWRLLVCAQRHGDTSPRWRQVDGDRELAAADAQLRDRALACDHRLQLLVGAG